MLKEYFSFELAVLSRTWKDTLLFAKQHLAIECFFIIFSAVAGAMMSPLEYSQWLNGLIIGVITVILMFATIALWNLCLAPFNLWGEQRKLLPSKMKGNADRLEGIFKKGQDLFVKLPDNRAFFERPDSWIIFINIWIDNSEKAIKDEAPEERFLYSSIIPKLNEKSSMDDCRKTLSARLSKLRQIIGDMQ